MNLQIDSIYGCFAVHATKNINATIVYAQLHLHQQVYIARYMRPNLQDARYAMCDCMQCDWL